MKIATLERLTAWLEEEDWFDEGQIFSYRPEPASVVPTRVELEIGRWVEGGLDPGDVMTFRVFRLLATGVTHFSIESPGHFPGTWSSDGVELDEDGLGLTISIVTPGLLRLTFHALSSSRGSATTVFGYQLTTPGCPRRRIGSSWYGAQGSTPGGTSATATNQPRTIRLHLDTTGGVCSYGNKRTLNKPCS